MLDQLILPKMQKAVADWNPKQLDKKVSLQTIVFPWLPLVGLRLEDFVGFSFWKGSFLENIQSVSGISRGFIQGLQPMNQAIELGPDTPSQLPKPDYRAEQAQHALTNSPYSRLSNNGDRAKTNASSSFRPSARTQEITFRSIVKEYTASRDLLFTAAGRAHGKIQDAVVQNYSLDGWKRGLLVYILDDAVRSLAAFFLRIETSQNTHGHRIHLLPSTGTSFVICFVSPSQPNTLTPRYLSQSLFKDLHISSTIPMRRSFEELQHCYNRREVRRISDADGEGYIYAFVDVDVWKIGMSKDFVRRQEEWDRNCPDLRRIWLPPIRVANRRRAESLAHLLLEMACIDRPRAYCQICQRKHIKHFIFSGTSPVVWRTIVEPILLWVALA
ncbi:hypothetical protein F5051DRAFT_476297 [Lentinula edodes]|nr:hypothetical protein F5051DRAFT_476297 [Lentinula edodes]